MTINFFYERKKMTDKYSFPPYEEKITELLKEFGGKKIETYKGADITPLWDMKGGAMAWSYKYLYSAPKLEKIIFGIQSYRDKLMTYTALIWPDDEHALPIFSSFWAENPKGSYFIVDFYPTADCICDIPYMEQYYEPVEDLYDENLKHFSKKVKQDPDWFRALVSPYCVTANISPSTKESQDRILDLTAGYLKAYISLWKKDTPREPEYMKKLIARKNALRDTLREKDPGGMMMERAVGKDLAKLTLKALF